MLRIGTNPQQNGNGLKLIVPEQYNVLWIRSVSDRNNIYRISPLDQPDDTV